MTDLQRVTRRDERPVAARRPAVARVGIVGCGVISRHYARNASAFSSFEVVACADLDPSRRDALAGEFGLASMDAARTRLRACRRC